MERKRIIARLDIKGENVVKGIQMEGLRVVGKPNQLARSYYRDGIDELLLLDVVASLYGRDSILRVIEQAANEIFVPLTVGGGVRKLDDAKALLMSGADKIALNSGALRNPKLISEIAALFGSQCVVLSVEAKQIGPDSWESYIDCGREPTGRDVLTWCKEATERGAGEILVTSIDRDGTKRGFDINLINRVSSESAVPVVGAGGAGCIDNLVEVFQKTQVDGVAIGSILHYGIAQLDNVKRELETRGIRIRK